MSVSTGICYPPVCRAWVCDHCGPRRMQRIAAAHDAYGANRFLTITLAEGSWRAKLARVRYDVIHGCGVPWEWAYVREAGPKNGMLHVHAVVRTANVDWHDLADICRRRGFGWPFIKPYEAHGEYCAKTAASYCAKARGGWAETMTLNDFRPWHNSHRFLERGGIRAHVAKYAPARDTGPWRLVHRPPETEWAACWMDQEPPVAMERPTGEIVAAARLRSVLEAREPAQDRLRRHGDGWLGG